MELKMLFRMVYQEFKARYNILGAKEVAKAKNDKAAAGAVLELVKLDKDKYRLGHTKIFFRFVYQLNRKRLLRNLVNYMFGSLFGCQSICPKQKKTKKIEKYLLQGWHWWLDGGAEGR